MRVLWLCNMVPGAVRECLGGTSGGGLWVDHMLSDLQQLDAFRLHILCPGSSERSGQVNDRVSFSLFTEGKPYEYRKSMEDSFCAELQTYAPEVIHIWGTEFAHTLAMVNAAERAGLRDRVVISIQGLCSVYAGHFCEGLPLSVRFGFTLRDLFRWDNVDAMRHKFVLRGRLEEEALRKTSHVIGRTSWDKACTLRLNPQVQYHFCNETLRDPFYKDAWTYDNCTKHRIFASNCSYPVKGFHYLLEAFREVLKVWPDATLTVPGHGFLPTTWKGKLMQDGYRKYLAKLVRRYGMEDRVTFLGALNAEQMKQAFLDANVFVLPSTIENSPNSLGEAMLLGVPCVSADVGGVRDMLRHGEEGYVYQSTAPYMLARDILNVFAMEERGQELGSKAAAHARITHDPIKNLQDLLAAYEAVAKGDR